MEAKSFFCIIKITKAVLLFWMWGEGDFKENKKCEGRAEKKKKINEGIVKSLTRDQVKLNASFGMP